MTYQSEVIQYFDTKRIYDHGERETASWGQTNFILFFKIFLLRC